jgi:hypothetical protein
MKMNFLLNYASQGQSKKLNMGGELIDISIPHQDTDIVKQKYSKDNISKTTFVNNNKYSNLDTQTF